MRRLTLCLSVAIFSLWSSVAGAHPHVWVKFRSEVVYADGVPKAVRHAWTFDDMFSVYALQGINHAKTGQYTREELSGLAQLNMTSLKEYDFFTYARVDGKKIKFSAPTDYWLEYRDAALTLHFTLPLNVQANPRDLEVEIYDPTIFVDFEFVKDEPVSLIRSPAPCRFTLGLPHVPTASEQKFLKQLDDKPLDASSSYGEAFANKIKVQCS